MLKNSIKLNRTPLVPTHSLLNYFVVEGLFCPMMLSLVLSIICIVSWGLLWWVLKGFFCSRKGAIRQGVPSPLSSHTFVTKKTGLGSSKPHTSL